MSLTRRILQHLLDHAGTSYAAHEVMVAAGLEAKANSASALLLGLLQHGCVARCGEKWRYRWYVPDTDAGRARARAYLNKPARGCGNRNAAFNGGAPSARAHDETPREHALPTVPGVARIEYPPEPLRFVVDDDGDLMILGRNTGANYLLIPKLDAVDPLEFARKSAPHLEAA